MRSDFAAFILSHGRPNDVITHQTLRMQGYTGRIIVLIDDMDGQAEAYRQNFGEDVCVFNKKDIAATFDTGDNFDDMRTIVYARNACFEVAKKLGIRYFVQLDDDYTQIIFRFNDEYIWTTKDVRAKNLDFIFSAFLDFLNSTPAKTVAMAQGGDFIGGAGGSFGSVITLRRKAMNSFFCETDNPIGFLGRVNEDVNTYAVRATRGDLLFTHNSIALNQRQTQGTAGGMTEVYLASGTYLKSFYTVMMHPSGAQVRLMQANTPRIHHAVLWENTAPKLIQETHKKRPRRGIDARPDRVRQVASPPSEP